MFLDRDERAVPPPREPSRRRPRGTGRGERATTALIVLAVTLVLLAPEVGAAAFVMARALAAR